LLLLIFTLQIQANNSTYQGGEVNYNAGKVSVEYVSRSESGRQGNFIMKYLSGTWNSVPKY